MIFYEIQSGRAGSGSAIIKKCTDFLHGPELPGAGCSVSVGAGITCTVSRYETVKEEDAVWEAHRNYVDLQCVLSGEEKIGIALTDQSRTGNYQEERDFLPLEGEAAAWVVLKPGTALCLFPNDAHRVKMRTEPDKPVLITKAVFKIPLRLFEA